MYLTKNLNSASFRSLWIASSEKRLKYKNPNK